MSTLVFASLVLFSSPTMSSATAPLSEATTDPQQSESVQLGAASMTLADTQRDHVDAGESPDAQDPAQTRAQRRQRRLGGFRLARFGVAAKTGYTHGTSATSGLFSRDQSIQDSLNNGSPTLSTGGTGTDQYGGFQSGFILDAEIVGLNLWFDFHKFYNPGGMWSLLLGYDHEFGFGRRVRLDVGAGAGVSHMFFGQLGAALSDPFGAESNQLGAAGLEARASADLHIKIAGPLYTGPSAMVGYHYLWAASTTDISVEHGLHYSFGWTLRLDLATPKLGGNRGRKRTRT